jgi:CheY-like chemotaxis protein
MRELSAIVFDDDDFFCSLFARILTEKGVKVTTYSNPSLYFCSQSSVQSCPVESPCVDFLLTDNKMPEMTGLEFLSRLEEMGCKIPDHRKAIASGSLEDEDQSRAKQLTRNVFDKSDSKQLIVRWIEESRKSLILVCSE